jgi:two-component system, OmpR family, sensor histidine kinase BaeS
VSTATPSAPGRRRRWGLRARLVVAFVAVALLGTVITTVYSSVSLTSHLETSAKARLHNSASHFGDVAAVVSSNGGWDQQAVETLHHLAQVDFLAVDLYDSTGKLVFSHPPSRPVQEGAAATAPVTAGGRRIGTVVVSRDDGRLFTAEEIQLRDELLRMHAVAGAVSAAIAVLIALYLAFTLSRPLRHIRAGAEAMSAGELDTRVPERGDDEMRSVAEALNRLAETLQLEEGLRKESVQDLAHELRTPVMGILARVEAAQDGVLDDEAANLSAMHDEALRLARLLDDLSALAEAERPGLLLETEPVDLAAVAGAQTAAFAAAFAGKDIALASQLRPAVVDGEPRRLEQVVVNLLSNALRYTDAGGSVEVSVQADGDHALLAVRDTGIGIAAEDLPRVFTRFWRGEKSRSRATGGAGIGLSIVKELVQAHGGRVTAESAPGEGTVFLVSLPLAQARQPM